MVIGSLLLISLGVNAWLFYRLWLSVPKDQASLPAPENKLPAANQQDVGRFYDEQTDNFLKVYGNVIQAFRTKDVSVLLDQQAHSMDLKPGMRLLDAGCGVCGPAIHFARHYGVYIEALTNSAVQHKKAQTAIAAEKLEERITVTTGDYHQLLKHYAPNSFDVVYFLESFGHAHNHAQVIDSAWSVLKPGGTIFIKDLFAKKSGIPGMQAGINREIQNINRAYHYNIPDLNALLDHIRKSGYILSSVSTIDIPLKDFENLTISNDFQELTGINKIDNLRNYIFPVDFFELKIVKPAFNPEAGNSRYFLQNMYLLQIENWKESDL